LEIISRNTIKSVIYDQQLLYKNKSLVGRLFVPDFSKDKEITILSGIRRAGKSSLLNIVRNQNKEKDYFINFDDERLASFTVNDFQNLYEVFIEIFGEQKTFYFDEIQNVEGWERFVRRLHDNGNKIYITGSNATMLSKELGTRLTGRYIKYELYPFSFQEFLKFKQVNYTEKDIFTTFGRAKLKSKFNEYFKKGGFPGFLENENVQYLKSLYESILYRDVMVRNKITNEKEILELSLFLASNTAKLITYNSLKKVIGVQNATTVKNYMKIIQDTYLISLVNKYDTSLKKQVQNPKKVYFVDVGLVRIVGFHNSDNDGRLLENLVFVELKRRAKDVYYHKNKYECDFVIKQKNKITEAIQVSWSLHNDETRKREINGLLDAMNTYSLKQGLILTENDEDNIKVNNKEITILPVWKWLLQYKLSK
jgi:predicted AAA+ superfamily ATPase